MQLPEAMYEQLRSRAFREGVSLSELVRRMLQSSLEEGRRPRPIESFTFIGAGRSDQGRLSPVSERHDEALAEP